MSSEKTYIVHKKSNLNRIKISDITTALPDFKNSEYSKVRTVRNWLQKWLQEDLASGKIQINNIIPSKAEFAYKLGVSIGTVQNALRSLEDEGLVESKQCVGTLVKDGSSTNQGSMRKLISKRDLAAEAVKRYILTGGFKVGSLLPSVRTIATIIGFTQNTTRLAMDSLCLQGILQPNNKISHETSVKVISLDFEISNNNNIKPLTLVDMVVKDIENYIIKNLKAGDQMPSHNQIANSLKTSLKTVHDALAILADKGIVLSRRGRYGSFVVKVPSSETKSLKPENSIFAPAKETAFYHYEKTQNHIKKMIAEKYEVGDKLPSIEQLSKNLDLSQNTVRKALQNLAQEGYLVFSRGRYGGTFVIDIPEVDAQAFKWIAVNPAYVTEEVEK